MEGQLNLVEGALRFTYNFNRLLKESGKTQKILSEEIGVTQSRISYWVHGMSTPTFVNLYNLSRSFGCSLDEFYKEVNEFEDEKV